MEAKNIPDIVVARLPLYLRSIEQMLGEGQLLTSSKELGERLGISSAQIRKDLSQFGEFGKQGTGYSIEFLISQIRQILKVDRIWDVVVIGAGDIGSAVARYQGFQDRGFKVVMVFDNDPAKIGMRVNEFIVQDAANLEEVIKKAGIKIAMLAVPGPAAQAITDRLVTAGVEAILNYAPVSLVVPPGVYVQNTDPVTHLQRMTYYL
jgi:redox-sensing transcriptional repressor